MAQESTLGQKVLAQWAVLTLRLAALLPDALRAMAGAGLGYVAMLILRRTCRVVDTNLAIAYPAASPKERRRLRRRHFRALGQAALDLGPLWYWPLPRALGLIREVSGAAAVDAAMAEGRGVILFTAHLGAWEAAVLYIGQRWPVTVMYMDTRNPAINALMVAGRGRSGARLSKKENGIRPLLQALKQGTAVGVLPDQNVDPSEGVYAPFFGRPACTTPLLGRLAARQGTPVFGLFAYRLPWGKGFRVEIVPLGPRFPSGDAEADAAAINRVLEQAIRRAPEQYWWVHRRFKDQPPGWTPPY
ncbi:lysophospholipid acyltransferase family protein [Acidithiobacillus sulfuriphilus]|uniref:lysophospholipid acyltransferase family protein n=1 Tax=Acidithiobacillus sulfuriphilus TaxID=1867749 RepID=UPI003F61803C